MTKAEANIIIQACLKYRIFHTCRSEAEVYIINFPEELEFRNFEAAKLAVNSIVLENRSKPMHKDAPQSINMHGLNFSRFPTKKKDYESGKWAENRMKDMKD